MKVPNPTKEVYSLNGEDFNCDELPTLVQDNELQIGGVVYKGTATIAKPSDFFHVDTFWEDLQEQAFEIYGEHA